MRAAGGRIAMTGRRNADPGDHRVGGEQRFTSQSPKALQPASCTLLQAERRVEEPLPDQAGDDERHGMRVQIDGAQGAFGAHALVDEGGEQETEHQAEDEEGAEEVRDDEAGVAEKPPYWASRRSRGWAAA
jgi:hypothetical protein